jgi:hypothetical protein
MLVQREIFPGFSLGNLTTTAIAFSSSPTAGQAIPSGYLRIIATQDCFIDIGENPVADSTKMLLVANKPEYFKFGDEQISVIRDTADGTLFISHN